MRSLRFLLTRRWLFFALAVVVLCYGTWWLGQWQFHRLADRQERNGIVSTNEDLAPEPVADVLSPGGTVAEEDEWRVVTATGTYDTDNTVVVRYRTRGGNSGVDAVVPLVTADGTALLVDRGWMASDDAGAATDLPPPPTGEVTVEGWVRADATGDSTVVEDRSTRAISSAEIGPAIDRTVYGGFVELRSEDGQPAAGLEPVELPELNDGPHFFYGLQWWFFGLLAVIGFCYLAYDEWRSRRAETESEDGSADEDSREHALSARQQRRAEKVARKNAVRAAYQRAYEAEREERERRTSQREDERSAP